MAYFDVDDPVRAQLQEAYELTGKGPTVTLDSVTGETTLGSKRNPTAADWQRSYHKYINNGGHLISAPKGMSNTRFYQHSLFQGKGLSYYSQPPVSQGLLADIQGTLEGTKAITEEETKESTDPNALVYRKRPPNEEQFGNEGTETVFNQGSSLDWMQWGGPDGLVALEKSRKADYEKLKESKVWSVAKHASLIARGLDLIIKSNSEQATRIMNERATLSGTNMQNPSWEGYRPEEFDAFGYSPSRGNQPSSALRGDTTWSPSPPDKSTANIYDYTGIISSGYGGTKSSLASGPFSSIDEFGNYLQSRSHFDDVRNYSDMSRYGDFGTRTGTSKGTAAQQSQPDPIDSSGDSGNGNGGGDGVGDSQGMGDQSPDSSGQGGYGWT